MGYTQSALKGISWMSAFRILTRGMTFAKTLVLARVLNPAQFGIFGIASLILSLLEILTETGINIVLVQSKEKIDDYIDSAWVVSIIRGFIISLLLAVSAPLIAIFFNTPSALSVILFISIVPLIRGFINPAEVNFQKNLQFEKEFLFRTSLFFFDASVSIVTALITHSVYSLVWGLVAGALLEVVLSFFIIRPLPRFTIHRQYFKEIFHKGKWITGYGIFSYIAENGDNFVVGKFMGAASLGIYQMAYKISILPISEISDVVSQVVFPVYTKIGNDRKRLARAFYRTIFYTSITSLVLGSIIFLFPEMIIKILLGTAWLAAVPVLKVLAVFGILRTVSGPASALFLALEKQKYVTLMTFTRFFALALTIYPLVTTFGLVGAGYSALISVIVETPLVIYFLVKLFKKQA
jgi:O-antigen/teichoic acid export membrane protein